MYYEVIPIVNHAASFAICYDRSSGVAKFTIVTNVEISLSYRTLRRRNYEIVVTTYDMVKLIARSKDLTFSWPPGTQ